MNLATCTVSYDGDKNSTPTDQRLALLEKATEKCQKKEIDLLCFPAGYLSAPSIDKITDLSNIIDEFSKSYNIHLVVGVDLERENKDKRSENVDKLLERGKLPYFAVYTSLKNPQIWRQRNTSSDKQERVHDDLCQEERTIEISNKSNKSNKSIEILICGEIFNERIRNSIIDRKIEMVVDIAHNGKDFRIHSPAAILTKNHISIFCSAHVKTKNGKKRYYYPKDNDKGYEIGSSSETDILIDDELRIEIKQWPIPWKNKRA